MKKNQFLMLVISLFPSVIGWVVLLALPLAHLILPKDWERDLFVWVGIPLEPKIVHIGGYTVMFAMMLALIAAAIYLGKNSTDSVLGKATVSIFAPSIVIGICGGMGFYMLWISQKLIAAALFSLPVVSWGVARWLRG